MSVVRSFERAGRALLVALVLVTVTCAALGPAGVARAESGTVTAHGLRLRSGIWGPVIAILPAGTSVRINARTRDQAGSPWYYVTTAGGSLGWLYAGYVAPRPDARARVGIQVGHWRCQEAGYPLNLHPGTELPGLSEVRTNLKIALALSRRLSARGVAVDLLPAAIPPGYRADAVVCIHADAGPSHVRGFFVDRPSRSPVARAEAALAHALVVSYAHATGIPYVNRSTPNSRRYYGFRAVDPMTPIVLVETGCLTNPQDRAVIDDRPDLVADALAAGIDSFLSGSSGRQY